jgi:hypothetical protein
MATWAGEWAPEPSRPPERFLVLGDPQAPLQRLFEYLDHQGLLTDDGWLHPDAGLICVGDYSDFAAEDAEAAGYDGVQFLSWLAAHPSTQTVLLLGNHDAERVCCLSACSLAAYHASQAAYLSLVACPSRDQRRMFLETWTAEHSHHPPIVAAHDYRAYVPAQGDMLRRLLLAGRIHLAATGVDEHGRPVLITHAGVTTREHEILGRPRDSSAWAHALQAFLARAIIQARPAWEAQRRIALDLTPLYTGWEHYRPNGGMLIHRPDVRQPSASYQMDLGLDPPIAPRAVDPADFLLYGLHQVVGHTVASRRLVPWLAPRVNERANAAPIGHLLWLRPDADGWCLDCRTSQAVTTSLTFVDISLATTAPEQIEGLWLQSVQVSSCVAKDRIDVHKASV